MPPSASELRSFLAFFFFFCIPSGNHEAWYNWTAVTSRFTMPAGPTGGAVPPFWWSMNHGLAHFAQLCSEFPLDADSPQVSGFAEEVRCCCSGFFSSLSSSPFFPRHAHT